ncbi:MAG: ATP-binding protein [Bacteroidetes bacterium]|nr:ATP-binding protein [Bacteroidota bacterium]
MLIYCTQKQSSSSFIEKKKVDSLYNQAARHVTEGNDEKAYYEFNLAKDGYLNNLDSLAAARCLTEMAIIQEYSSDNLGSIETSLAAIKLLHENKKEHHEVLFDNYTNLGINSLSLKNYSQAEKLYLKSLGFATDDFQIIKVQHNLAILYYQLKQFKRAKEIQQLVVSNLPKSNDNYYKALINYCRYLFHEDANFNPQPNYKNAEKHYLSIKDNWGLAATYCYLTEYYDKKNKDSSLFYAKKMHDVSVLLHSPTDELEALQNLIKHSEHPEKYFNEYLKISDSLNTKIKKSKNQFAIIRYESEKNLNENLKLEKDLSQKNYLLLLAIVLIAGSTTGSYIWAKSRKKKHQLLSDNKIKEERLATSKKIHDVVANGLYQVMTSLEHKQELNKDELLDKLEDMYQKSRDISYDKHLNHAPNHIREQISEIGNTFQNESMQVFIIGNENELWQQVPKKIHNDLYIIIQELFINTRKHSNATRIILRFEIESTALLVSYQDNGQCNTHSHIPIGNGLRNIKARAESHFGTITYPENNINPIGFKIQINLPIR